MKPTQHQDGLIERWTLATNELLLLMNKSGPGRLGFAALLKFFQAEGRFPNDRSDLPDQAVEYLVQQTKVPASALNAYDWNGRTIKYHRSDIRALFGYQEATVEGTEGVMAWLGEHVLPQERHPERILEAALQRFRLLKLEPPTPERLTRMIRSALRTFEENFGEGLFAQLFPGDEETARWATGASLSRGHWSPVAHASRRSRQRQRQDPGRRTG